MLRSVLLGFAAVLMLVAPATAEDKPTLTIYTYDSFTADGGPGPALKAGFERPAAAPLTSSQPTAQSARCAACSSKAPPLMPISCSGLIPH